MELGNESDLQIDDSKIFPQWWNLISNDLLVAQDLWEEREARNSVKVAQATYVWHHLHLPATGAKVSMRSQAYSKAVSHGLSLMYH